MSDTKQPIDKLIVSLDNMTRTLTFEREKPKDGKKSEPAKLFTIGAQVGERGFWDGRMFFPAHRIVCIEAVFAEEANG